MCGRYYVDDDTAKEIERIVRMANDRTLCCHMQKWGFPGCYGETADYSACCRFLVLLQYFPLEIRTYVCYNVSTGGCNEAPCPHYISVS